MKPGQIKAGTTYANRGKGRTTRKVIAIGNEHRPKLWLGATGTEPPDEPGVLYEQAGKLSTLYLSSFAQWAGKETT